MIGRREAILLLAVLAIDLYVPYSSRDRLGGQHEIDTQALILVKGTGTIIPPRKSPSVGKQLAVNVRKAPFEKTLKPSPLFAGMKDLATQLCFVPGVQGCGTNVEVTAEDHRLGLVMAFSEIICEGIQPVQFSWEIRMADVFAVRTINSSKRQITHGRRDEARP